MFRFMKDSVYGKRSVTSGSRTSSVRRQVQYLRERHRRSVSGLFREGPQGDDYSIVKECEDVLALQAETGASLLVGHSYGGLVALEVARNNKAFHNIAVYEPGVSIDGSMPTKWMPGYEKKIAEKRNVDALVEFTLADAPPRIQKTPR